MRRAALIVALVGSVVGLSAAHTAEQAGGQAAPAFEVASIKPSPPPDGPFGVMPGIPNPAGRWVARNATLLTILRTVYFEYRFPGQIVDAPEWVGRTMWDIEARYPPETPYADVRRMAGRCSPIDSSS